MQKIKKIFENFILFTLTHIIDLKTETMNNAKSIMILRGSGKTCNLTYVYVMMMEYQPISYQLFSKPTLKINI